MRKFFVLVSLLFVSTFVSTIHTHAAMNTSSVLGLINSERKAVSLTEVAPNSKLNEAAQMKATDMAAKSYFAHVGPDGNGPTSWLAATGYQWSSTGEILAYNTQESESAIVQSWMNSSEHKAIILDGRYTETGIGIAVGTYQGMRVVFVAEEFGVPKNSAALITPAPSIPIPATVSVAATAKPVIASAQITQPVVTTIPVVKPVTKPVVMSVAKAPVQVVTVSAPKIATAVVQVTASTIVPTNTAVVIQGSWFARLESHIESWFVHLIDLV